MKNETSPYLLQHTENPVNWYPWCEEAFAKAKEEDKPVFLSIGYSTCHWCHVMAHESFEDEGIAEILNRDYVAIKVDREERPDIDSIYMSVCQAFTGSGGWPTSIFMTYDQKPFFAGTYFPKTARGGMMGLRELLSIISEKWITDRRALLSHADIVLSHLKENTVQNSTANVGLTDYAVEQYKKNYDRKNGGFGRVPKFPAPHNLLFLFSYYERYADPLCLDMAEHTLMQMYRGGMFDHIGGGFCRYSTDAFFLAPHFEKMLYDNALLILAYCKAYRVTKKPLYLEVAEKTAAYILREMTSPEGGFYSAQDADSEGEEGKYYTFTPSETIQLLGENEGNSFNDLFDITEKGNFEAKNIPNLLHSDINAKLSDELMQKVYEYRKKRYPLHLDDKILTSWNSLMIAAMCELYRANGKKIYLTAAVNADRFIQQNLGDGDRLFVSFREGKRGVNGFLDDYAFYIFAQLALYGATLDDAYLNRAKTLTSKVFAEFRDEKGGFYLYGSDSKDLILRPKETYDGALPSGNSLMAFNLVRLYQLTSKEMYMSEVSKLLDFLAADAEHYPMGYSMYLHALLEHYNPSPKLIAVAAEQGNKEDLPLVIPPEFSLTAVSPTEQYPLVDNRTTFYMCRNHTCLPPENDLNKLI